MTSENSPLGRIVVTKKTINDDGTVTLEGVDEAGQVLSITAPADTPIPVIRKKNSTSRN